MAEQEPTLSGTKPLQEFRVTQGIKIIVLIIATINVVTLTNEIGRSYYS